MEKEVAYNKVIGSIGNVEDLFGEGDIITQTKQSFSRKKHARNIAIAVMLYILSPVCVIIFDNFGNEDLGLILMFVFIALATGLIIYTSMVNTKYKKQETFRFARTVTTLYVSLYQQFCNRCRGIFIQMFRTCRQTKLCCW